MATIDILSLIKLGDLSPEQAAHLKKRLLDRRRDLEAALKKVEEGLKALGQKPKARKTAKRKARR
jgi:hypothetical protein